MTISTFDQLTDAVLNSTNTHQYMFKNSFATTPVVGKPNSWWAATGVPGSGSYDTTLAGVALATQNAGGLRYVNASGGDATYISNFTWATTRAPGEGQVVLADRLWHNGGFTITSTGSQTVTSATFPARDANGSTDGAGVQIALEISATVGAATPGCTVTYTNSAGTGSRSATLLDTTGRSAAGTSSMFRFKLAAGDAGVRSVQTLQLDASWVSGTMNLVAYRPLIALTSFSQYFCPPLGPLRTGLPKVYDNSILYVFQLSRSNENGFSFGSIAYAQG